MHPSDKDHENPVGRRYAEDFCEEHKLDPELWGHINDAILDGYGASNNRFAKLANLLEAKAIDQAIPLDYATALNDVAKTIRAILNDTNPIEAIKSLK